MDLVRSGFRSGWWPSADSRRFASPSTEARRGKSVGSGKSAPAPSARLAGMSPISRKRLPATEHKSKTLRTHENQMGGALCTVCAYVRSARSMPIQLGRPLSAFPAHTRNHLAHGAKGPKWGSSGGGGICACVGYRGVLGCSDHDPASRSSSRRADHSANCRSIRPWFMTQPACTSTAVARGLPACPLLFRFLSDDVLR